MPGLPPLNPMARQAYGGGGFYQQPQPNRKVLAAGVATDAAAPGYTVPRATQAEVTSIHVFNTDGGAQTIDFYIVTPGGTGRIFARASLTATTSAQVITAERINLSPDWEIHVEASLTNVVNYLITGIEYVIPTGGATA